MSNDPKMFENAANAARGIADDGERETAVDRQARLVGTLAYMAWYHSSYWQGSTYSSREDYERFWLERYGLTWEQRYQGSARLLARQSMG